MIPLLYAGHGTAAGYVSAAAAVASVASSACSDAAAAADVESSVWVGVDGSFRGR